MLTRRSFIASTTALSFAVGFPRSAFAAETADVIVIGGGLSGLNAALQLKKQGFRPILLEADAQVGGRVKTVDSADGPIDLGGAQVGRSYARVIDACNQLGLRLIPEHSDLLTFGAYYKDTWIDNATWANNPLNKCVGDERAVPPMMMGSHLVGKYNPLQDVTDWLDPKFANSDISLRQLLRRKGNSDQAIELAALSAPGIGIDQTSVLRMWQEDTRGKFDRQFADASSGAGAVATAPGAQRLLNPPETLTITSNVEGGCHKLPAAMAAALGDAIRLDKRVVTISMTNSAGEVRCVDGSRYKAKFIISAIPFSMLRKIDIKARPGGAAADAVAHMPYANTARLFLTVDRPFWLDDGLPPSFATDGPMGMFWAIDNNKGSAAHRALIVMTGPCGQRIRTADRAAEERFLIDELARLRPASKGKVRINAYKDWGADPLQSGCGFSLAPGQVNRFARAMNEPWQIMHFAGEHTRRIDFGMEAAMESGERAAIEIITRVG